MRLLCLFGIHDFEDKIEIVGPKNDKGLPVRVYQLCKRCYKKGNEVFCHIDLDKKEEKG